MAKFFETVENDIVSTLKSELQAKGYDITGKKYFVEKLDNVSNKDVAELFNQRAISAQNGGIFVTTVGCRPELQSKKTYIDEWDFLILAFLKVGTQNKSTDLYKLLDDIDSILYSHRFTNNQSAKRLEKRNAALPSKTNSSIYYGWVAISLKETFMPN